jgi:hypothetical protein
MAFENKAERRNKGQSFFCVTKYYHKFKKLTKKFPFDLLLAFFGENFWKTQKIHSMAELKQHFQLGTVS